MIHHFLDQIAQAQNSSHKGQNGKVLIIGGSDLFHAAAQWSFLAASRWVDMVFYSSVKENNEILRASKSVVQDGVVIPRQDIPAYIQEADTILLGPGMRRDVSSRFSDQELLSLSVSDLSESDWENDTRALTSVLLRTFPEKRWLLDAGSLQTLDLSILPKNTILTPHRKEFENLLQKAGESLDTWHTFLSSITLSQNTEDSSSAHVEELLSSLPEEYQQKLTKFSQKLGGATILLKGSTDLLWDSSQVFGITGGNAGMTKGGTGDALAGMIAAFWTGSPALASAATASFLNKQAAHELWLERGMMYNTSDLVDRLPTTWGKLAQ